MTSSVASVPPVDAPRPISTCPSAGVFPSKGLVPAGCAGCVPGRAVGIERTLAKEAITIFCDSVEMNSSLVRLPSGFRTKSTAPAASASKTRRFRDETRITRTEYLGRSCLSRSMPLMSGISTSKVITSGCRASTLRVASAALMA